VQELVLLKRPWAFPFSGSSGHDIGHDRSGEIMSVLASHMK